MKIKYIITVDAQEAEDKKLELEEISSRRSNGDTAQKRSCRKAAAM